MSIVGPWRRQPVWYLIAGIAAAILFIGGVACGLLLPKKDTAERVWSRLSALGRQWSPKGPEDVRTFAFETIETGLTPLEVVRIPVGTFAGGGGAIAAVGNYVLFATPKGKLGYLRPGAGGAHYGIRLIDAAVPMNYPQLQASAFARDPEFNANYFRTLGMLAVPRVDGAFDLYVSHHRYARTCIEFVVSRAVVKISQDGLAFDASGWKDIFVAEPCIAIKRTGHPFAGHESGGRLAMTAANMLLVTIGDHEFDGVNGPTKASMDPQTHLGKAVEINLDTNVPAIYASGLRNPQGLFVSADGLIWETEHGPHGGDEVNVLQRGRNYGWPEVSYGVDYGFPSRPWPANRVQGRHDGYTKPVFAFVPSIGISNLIETDTGEFPLWRGDLLVTSLKDSSIWRLRRDADRIVYSERINLGERLRDIQELPNGQLILLTDNQNLIVVRRKPTVGSDADRAPARITVAGYDALNDAMAGALPVDGNEGSGPEFGQDVFKARCASCHTVSGETAVGPSLRGIVGREVGSVEGYPYSTVLAGADGVWTKQLLLDFLSNPQGKFTGTTMPEVILPYRSYEPIIEYLQNTD